MMACQIADSFSLFQKGKSREGFRAFEINGIIFIFSSHLLLPKFPPQIFLLHLCRRVH